MFADHPIMAIAGVGLLSRDRRRPAERCSLAWMRLSASLASALDLVVYGAA